MLIAETGYGEEKHGGRQKEKGLNTATSSKDEEEEAK